MSLPNNDPTIGRFISPDTIIPSPANPQSFNRYSYCLNNPLKYVDPSGYQNEYITLVQYYTEQARIYNEVSAAFSGQIPWSVEIKLRTQQLPEHIEKAIDNISNQNNITSPEPTYPPEMTKTETGASLSAMTKETTKNEQIQPNNDISTIENIGTFIVGYLLLETGTVWSLAGVLAIEVPPLAAGLEIVAAAHYYVGTICIVNASQGKGFPSGNDFSAFFRESWQMFKGFFD